MLTQDEKMSHHFRSIRKKFNKAGFTLIELLVVIAILAILMSVAIIGVGLVQKAARDNTRLRDITSVKQALEDYYGAYRKYPNAITSDATEDDVYVKVGLLSKVNLQQSGCGNLVPTACISTGISDPTTCAGLASNASPSAWYIGYTSINGGVGYYLCTVLENGTTVNQSTP